MSESEPSGPSVDPVSDAVARISWRQDENVDVVRREVAAALVTHPRVETHIGLDDSDGQRTATWAGMRREGVMRGVDGDVVIYARLATDDPVNEPGGFRALLNSFLPRKRAIGQLLIRDDSTEPRVLLCQLTYKQDWDLPGGVVEVGESPRDAVGREVLEELALDIPVGPLLLTDWLPPWGGWDDAVCLVFDGGTHPASITERIVKQAREIRDAQFCTIAEADERCADFTARRVRAALSTVGGAPAYTESGRS